MENTSPATSHYNAGEAESSVFAENLPQVQLNFRECNVYTGAEERMAFGTCTGAGWKRNRNFRSLNR
jgi:hypothetical protein